MSEEARRQSAFEALYTSYADAVYRYALRRAGRDVDPDDVVAETFATCWRRLDAVPEGRELPWLYGTARRVLANQRRSVGRQERLRTRLETEPPVTSEAAVEEGTARAVLDRLAPRDREILLLATWEQLTTADIAIALGISENAVYIRLHRARQRFQAAFEAARDEERGGER